MGSSSRQLQCGPWRKATQWEENITRGNWPGTFRSSNNGSDSQNPTHADPLVRILQKPPASPQSCGPQTTRTLLYPHPYPLDWSTIKKFFFGRSHMDSNAEWQVYFFNWSLTSNFHWKDEKSGYKEKKFKSKTR